MMISAAIRPTGSTDPGCWCPIAIAGFSFVVALVFLPETMDRAIETMD
jgi:hypothetical protein